MNHLCSDDSLRQKAVVDKRNFLQFCRGLKNRLAAQYPEAFKESVVGQIADTRPDLENEMGWKK